MTLDKFDGDHQRESDETDTNKVLLRKEPTHWLYVLRWSKQGPHKPQLP